ncbi:hypothetical protein ACHAWF_005327 [Thalassiosira exigua]
MRHYEEDQEIRNKLNNETLQKSAKKVRKSSSKKRDQFTPDPGSIGDSFGGKAGKVIYPVLFGEGNLYATSKSFTTERKPVVLDLHGLSRDDAVEKLNKSLSSWVNTAMKGGYPFVLLVDIMCGGRNQILSDAVKDWVRNNRQVANRPKSQY